MMAEKVEIIPATMPAHAARKTCGAGRKVRVAAYCRVSTAEECQKNSYRNQIAYYTKLIGANPDWEMVAVFADEGLSGTQAKNRKQFGRMIRACVSGKIDVVLCKSISRFARNTVDCLGHVRKLKGLGVAVIFEKENINTLAVNSEFIISLYASFAQAESESISKNITWGIEKKFREGNVRYKMDQTLGYRLVAGKPVVIESEACVVREIFELFAGGVGLGQIARLMTSRGVVRRCGSSVWSRRNVEVILRNEKYAGMCIMQKTFTVDCLTHERALNRGQKAKYVVRGAHEAIVSEGLFEQVQKRLERRGCESGIESGSERGGGRVGVKKSRPSYLLNQLLVCPYCGAHYRRVIWQSCGARYGVWRCSGRLDGGRLVCPDSVSLRESWVQEHLCELIADRWPDLEMPEFDETVVEQVVKRVIVWAKDKVEVEFWE